MTKLCKNNIFKYMTNSPSMWIFKRYVNVDLGTWFNGGLGGAGVTWT